MCYNRNMWMCLLIAFITLLTYSCNNNKSNSQSLVVDRFNYEGILDFETIEIPPLVLSPSNLIISEDKLLLYQAKKDTLFDVFQLPECTYLYSDGLKGQGPTDFNNVDVRSFFPTPHGFSFFEMGESMLKEVLVFNDALIVNDETKQYFDIMDRPVNGFKQLNDSLFFYWAVSSKENEYILLNKHTSSSIYRNILYPNWEKNQNLEEIKGITFMKNDVVKSDGTLFASFYAYFKRIRIHDSLGNLQKDIVVDIPPTDEILEKEIKDRMVFYYTYPQAVNEYIYVFCKNASYKNMEDVSVTEMQVWKWDGTPVASFKINANLSIFNVSEKYKKIYAVDRFHENIIYVLDLPYM